MVEINIARDFSRTPAGRTRADHGGNSGEVFRRSVLLPKLQRAIKEGSKLVVVLDGVAGYPASFIDEAFGGLIRIEGISKQEIEKHLVIKANSPTFEPYRKLCLRYMSETSS